MSNPTALDVIAICTAYESGFGHGLCHDTVQLCNPYALGTGESQAYQVGFDAGAKKRTPTPQSSKKDLTYANQLGDQVVQNVCELPGYTSPDDQPNLLMCTMSELHDCVLRAIEALPAETNGDVRALFNKGIGAQKGNRFSFAFETEDEANRAFHYIADLGTLETSQPPKHPETSDEPVVAWMTDDGRICTAQLKASQSPGKTREFTIPLYRGARPWVHVEKAAQGPDGVNTSEYLTALHKRCNDQSRELARLHAKLAESNAQKTSGEPLTPGGPLTPAEIASGTVCDIRCFDYPKCECGRGMP